MFFDSHAHLDETCFHEDFDQVVAHMRENNVMRMMNIGADLPSSERSVALAERYDWIWAAVGSHPDDAENVDEARIALYREMCKNPRVRAIGEIGLDYFHDDVPREAQKNAFRLQLELARELTMPVVIHAREAHDDVMEILDDYRDVYGVFHCYSGSLDEAKELVQRGWYLSFTGTLTFKNARRIHIVDWLPLERIMVETDSPYMAPEPFRGQRCDPSMVVRTAMKIAEIKGLPLEAVEKATYQNACDLFGV